MRLARFAHSPEPGGQVRLSIATVAAVGSTQANAVQLVNQMNIVTAADGTKGVALPVPATSGAVFILNTVADQILKVWPMAGRDDTINGGAADAVFLLGPGKASWFIPQSGTAWYAEVEESTGSITIPAGQSINMGAGSNIVMGNTANVSFDRGTLAAAGTTAANGGAITKQIHIVTGADGVKGVVLPGAGSSFGPFFIYNDASAVLLVWPANGGDDQINGEAANTAFKMAAGEMAIFIPTSGTQYYVPTRAAQGSPRSLTRSTVVNSSTLTAAQTIGGILFMDASGGAVSTTTRTGTEIAADFPEMRTGDALDIYMSSNHASNTATLSPGSGVTAVGSGACTQLGGSFKLHKTGAATFDLVRVG